MPEIYKIGGVHVKAIDVLSFEYQRRAAKRREEEERHFYRIAKPKDDQRCYGADELARRLGVKERRARAFAAHLRERGIGVLGVDGAWFNETELARAVEIWQKSTAA